MTCNFFIISLTTNVSKIAPDNAPISNVSEFGYLDK